MYKKIIFFIVVFISIQSEAQISRNDHYTAFGIISDFGDIPYGVSIYSVSRTNKYGFFSELRINRLKFESEYTFQGYHLPSDELRGSEFISNKSLIKMITIGTLINPQKFGVLEWDIIDFDFVLGIGYMQNFKYNFYIDTDGINTEDLQSDPLGKYYVIDYNQHGVNLKIGTNISLENYRLMLHIGYDTHPKRMALGFNWKMK
jgi:hypothetical protein